MALTTVRPQGMGFVTGRRNLIINGAMQVAQRGTQTGQGGTANAYTAVDRYQLALSGAKTPRVTSSQQSTTTGEFANQLKLDCTTSQASVAAADLFVVRQRIEGQNLQHLQYGTSSAKTLTASFTITSPKSGTHCVQLYHRDANYSYVREFTVDAANTAQRISVTFPGYTTTALDNDNASSLELSWPLLAGSNWQTTKDSWNSGNYFATSNQQNLLDDTANDFLITGVQLEVGTNASDFEHRSFGEELALCQRYFQGQGTTAAAMDASGDTKQSQLFFNSSLGFPSGATHRLQLNMQRNMRAAPTVYISDNNGNLGRAFWSATNTPASTFNATSFSVVLLLTSITTSTSTDIWVNYSLEAEL